MTEITEYNTYTKHNTQEDLQRLATNIFAFGKITEINHFIYTTNNPAQGGNNEQFAAIKDGGVCYTIEADGFPCKFYIHMTGFTVTNITEQIER